MDPDRLTRTLRTLAKRAGLLPIRLNIPGTKRRRWPEGTELDVVQRFPGHAQVTTTRIYTRPADPLTGEGADRIKKAL